MSSQENTSSNDAEDEATRRETTLGQLSTKRVGFQFGWLQFGCFIGTAYKYYDRTEYLRVGQFLSERGVLLDPFIREILVPLVKRFGRRIAKWTEAQVNSVDEYDFGLDDFCIRSYSTACKPLNSMKRIISYIKHPRITTKDGSPLLGFTLEGRARETFLSWIDAGRSQAAAKSGSPPAIADMAPPIASSHAHRECGSENAEEKAGGGKVRSAAGPSDAKTLVAIKLLVADDNGRHKPVNEIGAIRLPLDDFLEEDGRPSYRILAQVLVNLRARNQKLGMQECPFENPYGTILQVFYKHQSVADDVRFHSSNYSVISPAELASYLQNPTPETLENDGIVLLYVSLAKGARTKFTFCFSTSRQNAAPDNNVSIATVDLAEPFPELLHASVGASHPPNKRQCRDSFSNSLENEQSRSSQVGPRENREVDAGLSHEEFAVQSDLQTGSKEPPHGVRIHDSNTNTVARHVHPQMVVGTPRPPCKRQRRCSSSQSTDVDESQPTFDGATPDRLKDECSRTLQSVELVKSTTSGASNGCFSQVATSEEPQQIPSITFGSRQLLGLLAAPNSSPAVNQSVTATRTKEGLRLFGSSPTLSPYDGDSKRGDRSHFLSIQPVPGTIAEGCVASLLDDASPPSAEQPVSATLAAGALAALLEYTSSPSVSSDDGDNGGDENISRFSSISTLGVRNDALFTDELIALAGKVSTAVALYNKARDIWLQLPNSSSGSHQCELTRVQGGDEIEEERNDAAPNPATFEFESGRERGMVPERTVEVGLIRTLKQGDSDAEAVVRPRGSQKRDAHFADGRGIDKASVLDTRELAKDNRDARVGTLPPKSPMHQKQGLWKAKHEPEKIQPAPPVLRAPTVAQVSGNCQKPAAKDQIGCSSSARAPIARNLQRSYGSQLEIPSNFQRVLQPLQNRKGGRAQLKDPSKYD